MVAEFGMVNVDKCIWISVPKSYTVHRHKTHGTRYMKSADWIAEAFYREYDENANNIAIHIYGDFHRTYPNEPHLRVEITHNRMHTGMLHFSINPQNGFGYIQYMHTRGGQNTKRLPLSNARPCLSKRVQIACTPATCRDCGNEHTTLRCQSCRESKSKSCAMK